MRPCEAPCGRWCGCKEIDCEKCALAPREIVPGEPGRDDEPGRVDERHADPEDSRR